MYIPRHAEKAVQTLSAMFGAVLVTGARQVGKTTMLQHQNPDMPMMTFDDAATLAAAAQAPELFFSYNPPPIFLDEIQKAPDLFSEMKQIIDARKTKGLFFLSGSQQFQLMDGVSESLAGRIGILNLCGLSLREEQRIPTVTPFVPTTSHFDKMKRADIAVVGANDIWRKIHRGSMPALVTNPDFDWAMYYGAYVRTYIERDVRSLAAIADELKFQTFMTVLAARTGQMINMSEVAGSVGISQPTAQRWLSILKSSNVIYLLRPYFTNATKRAIKTAKLYFTDTGLAAYLGKWNTHEVLRDGAMAGAFFENYAVMQVIKSYYNAGILEPPVYYYRDKNKNEIDILILSGGKLHPIEIKKKGNPTKGDISSFKHIKDFDSPRGSGGVICLSDKLLPLTEHDSVIPITYV